jgi:hypothetical protein
LSTVALKSLEETWAGPFGPAPEVIGVPEACEFDPPEPHPTASSIDNVSRDAVSKSFRLTTGDREAEPE